MRDHKLILFSKDTLLITVVYTLAFGLMLLNRGLYWDDWTIHRMSEEGLMQQFVGNGAYYSGVFHLHYFLQALPASVFIYKLIAFVSFLLSSLICYNLFNRSNLFRPYKLQLALVIATAPFFSTRITEICLPYTLDLLLFVIAFHFGLKERIVPKLIALVLFFVSFFTNSLLVFYGWFILWKWFGGDDKNVWNFIKRHVAFIILPIAFWVFKSIAIKPSGLHALEGYNEISVNGIAGFPAQLFTNILENLVYTGHLFYALMITPLFFVLFAALAMIIYLLIPARKKEDENDSQTVMIGKKKFPVPVALIVIGLLVFASAVFPYDIVNKAPSFAGFNTRNQLLIGISYGIMICGLAELFTQTRYKKTVYAFMIGSAVLINIAFILNFQKNHNKQQAIIAVIKQQPVPYTTMLVYDSTSVFNEGNLSSAHTYNALLKFATGNQTHMALTPIKKEHYIAAYGSLDLLLTEGESICIKDWKPAPFNGKMIIGNGSLDLTSAVVTMKLLVAELTNPSAYNETIRQAINIRYEPIQ